MRLLRIGACLLALAFCVKADAAITEFSTSIVDNSGAAALANYVTQDILVTGTGQLTSVEMLLDAGAGNIYQDAVGNNMAPNALFFPTFPSLAFDTYVGLGGRVAGEGFSPSVAGGAVDIGGAAASTFTDAKIDMTWFPAGGDVISDPTDYFVARVSIANDYNGTVNLAAFTGTEGYTAMGVNIENGVIVLDDTTPPGIVAEYVGPGASISEGLQGAFAARNFGPIMLADAFMLSNVNGGELAELDPLTAEILIGTDNAVGSIEDLDGDGKYDILIDADFASLAPGATIGGEILFASGADGANPNLVGFDFSVSVPEPSTFAIAGLALVGLVGFARRK